LLIYYRWLPVSKQSLNQGNNIHDETNIIWKNGWIRWSKRFTDSMQAAGVSAVQGKTRIQRIQVLAMAFSNRALAALRTALRNGQSPRIDVSTRE
jgi:hypothetical protein